MILEEAIVELLHHQRHIAYADVQLQELTSKKRAYGLFGAVTLREEEKAEAEQVSGRTKQDHPKWPRVMALSSHQPNPSDHNNPWVSMCHVLAAGKVLELGAV